jgi:broad specificity phosphatase PhoE
MRTLLLVRHGETEWNRTGQIMGEEPVPLNHRGEEQARCLATILEHRSIHAIYSSPVARAHQTADILATSLQLYVTVDRGLTEVNVGEWVGRFWTELADDQIRRNFYINPQDTRPPGGETLREVQARAVSCVERILADGVLEDRETDQVVFVSHADVLRTIIAHYLRLDLQTIRQARIDHASLTALRVNGETTDLLCLNYTPEPAGLA